MHRPAVWLMSDPSAKPQSLGGGNVQPLESRRRRPADTGTANFKTTATSVLEHLRCGGYRKARRRAQALAAALFSGNPP